MLLSIIHGIYPTTNGENIVAPEVHLSAQNRADLLVRMYTYPAGGGKPTRKPVLLYEGKGSAGDSWERLESQLFTYLDKTAGFIANGKRCWALGGRGSEMKLWRFRKGNSEEQKLLPWAVEGGQAVEKQRRNAPPPYSVATNYDYVKILMDYVAAHPDPDN